MIFSRRYWLDKKPSVIEKHSSIYQQQHKSHSKIRQNKSRSSSKIITEPLTQPEPEEESANTAKLLSDQLAIFFNVIPSTKSKSDIGPQSPVNEYDFNQLYTCVPDEFPSLDGLEIPYIKEKGVKECIRILGDYLHVNDYELSLTHFWLLDVLVDCLWRLQDDFNFTREQQKVVLEWILAIFNILRDPKLNLSRKQYYNVVKAAIFMAADVISEGSKELPLPKDLFKITVEEETPNEESSDDESVDSSDTVESNISMITYDEEKLSMLNLIAGSGVKKFVLEPQSPCSKSLMGLTTSSSTDQTFMPEVEKQPSEEKVEEDLEEQEEEEIEYYKPDKNVPARWLPLPSSTVKEMDNITILNYPVRDVLTKRLSRNPRSPESLSSELKILEGKEKRKSSLEESSTAADGLKNSRGSIPLSIRQVPSKDLTRSRDNSKVLSSKAQSKEVSISSKIASVKSIAFEEKNLVKALEQGDIKVVEVDSEDLVVSSSEETEESDICEQVFGSQSTDDFMKKVTIRSPLAKKASSVMKKTSKDRMSQEIRRISLKISSTRIPKKRDKAQDEDEDVLEEDVDVKWKRKTMCPHEFEEWMNRQAAKKENILKGLATQKLWEQRIADMADPNKGWVPSESMTGEAKAPEEVIFKEDLLEEDDEDPDWEDIIEKEKNNLEERRDMQLISLRMLNAVIDLFFDYFYERFHFTLIRLTYQGAPNVITQHLNDEWKEPKVPKEDLVKPKEEKPKKDKKQKEKKKGEKKDAKKGKKPKEKPKKGSKKSEKSKKGKKDKKDKKGKKDKKAKMSKEEKEEQERLRMEQEALEAEQRRLEENKRFMFPLNDGTGDEFFQDIFEDWKRAESTTGKKGEKKGKKKK